MGCVVNVAAGARGGRARSKAIGPVRRPADACWWSAAARPVSRPRASSPSQGHAVTLDEATRTLGRPGGHRVVGPAPRGHRRHHRAGSRRRRSGSGVTIRRGVDRRPGRLVAGFGADDGGARDGCRTADATASSCRPRVIALPGHDLPHVSTSWEVFGFGGRADVGERAVVLDDTGTFEAIRVAEQLLSQGCAVTLRDSVRPDGRQRALPAGNGARDAGAADVGGLRPRRVGHPAAHHAQTRS